MASIKIILQKRADKNGKFPLSIRVIKDRKPSYMFIGHALDNEDQWDEVAQRVRKTHPNSVRLNNLLLKKLAEANDKLIELETNNKDHSSKVIIKKIKPEQGVSFFSQAKIFIDNLRKEGKYNRVNSEKPRIKRFREFLNGEDIVFNDITVPLLNKFRAYLKATRKVGTGTGEQKPISERTIINHLIVIRTIYNQAVASNIADIKNYPFGKGKIVIKFPESVKIGLNADEGKLLEEFASNIGDIVDFSFIRERKIQDGLRRKKGDLTAQEQYKLDAMDLIDRHYLKHTANVWLFAFYFAGMRVSDVLRLKWSDIQNERLYYAMGKNDKAGSLKIPEKALAILNQYKADEKKSDLVFPELKILDNLNSKYEVQRKISYVVKRLNKALAAISTELGLTKKLTMHIARHTFGNLSGEKIPIQMLQKLYRHSSVTTTIGYQANFIHKEADEALDSVVAF